MHTFLILLVCRVAGFSTMTFVLVALTKWAMEPTMRLLISLQVSHIMVSTIPHAPKG